VLQIDVELRWCGLKLAGIACAALARPRMALLGGDRAAPYPCIIGDHTLRIAAERTYFDGRGIRLG